MKLMFLIQSKFWKKVAKVTEMFLAGLTLIAVFWYTIVSATILIGMDWADPETFQLFINKMLVAIIGIELMRMLLYHSIGSVLELLAFVIARKMLYPDLTSIDLFINTGAFMLLMAARHFLMEDKFYVEKEK